jgi:hypothetical protein
MVTAASKTILLLPEMLKHLASRGFRIRDGAGFNPGFVRSVSLMKSLQVILTIPYWNPGPLVNSQVSP